MKSIDIARLRQWIGHTRECEETLTPRLVDEYRATLAPYLASVDSGEAPLALHWCLAAEMGSMAELGPDGHSLASGFMPPSLLPRRMWAGGEIRTLGPLRIGDRVLRRSTIADIGVKEGRSGQLCFVTLRHELATGRGVAILERQDMVYRAAVAGNGQAMQSSSTAKAAEGPPEADLAWIVDATPVLLFRYSALTFNGHRIHYDHPYATEVERYPGILVHGPLQASLLINLAASLGGSVPRQFSYRAIAPLVGGKPFDVRSVHKSSDRIECWTQDAAGQVTMLATATWQ